MYNKAKIWRWLNANKKGIKANFPVPKLLWLTKEAIG